MKKDIRPMGSVLANIRNLPSYSFRYTDNKPTDPVTIGFMAQDVQPLFPEAVSEISSSDGTKKLGIKYQYFAVYAVKAIQEQQAMIDTRQKQIDELKKMVEELIKQNQQKTAAK